MVRPSLTTSASLLVALCISAPARALEPVQIGDEALQLDVTAASSLIYNADNRNDEANVVTTRTDDEWGWWYNRLNVQGTYGKFQLGLRLDTAYFYTSPNPVQIGLDMVETRRVSPDAPPESNAAYFRRQVFAAGTELSNRYISWTYPAKYYVGYTTRDVEVTVGDFYAQLGRGMVLSVRKLDELSSDTTVRGARVTARIDPADGWRIKLTGLGGEMNPLRIDEASGRYIGVDSSVTPGFLALTEAGMPRTVETDYVPDPEPTYAPDSVVAGQIEVGTSDVKLGTQAAYFRREAALNPDVVRTADTVLNGSQSVSIPDIAGKANAYVEVALQKLEHSGAPETDLEGHAVYGSFGFIEHPFSLLLEGKHYRRFYPVQANVDLSRSREFSLVQYSAAPTTEAFWIDTEFENFNTCVTGGRAKADLHLDRDASVFLWAGRYFTWAESVANERCEIADENLNRVWDFASGTEITSQGRKSRAAVTVGARIDETDRLITDARGAETHTFYQENYIRYDIVRWIDGPWSVQFQGWHRKRRQTFGGPQDVFYQGQHLTALQWAPKLSIATGVEFDTDPNTPTMYYNAQVRWNFSSATNASIFVGQRRGALRCVSGVCRVFPPFEGARLDVTARF